MDASHRQSVLIFKYRRLTIPEENEGNKSSSLLKEAATFSLMHLRLLSLILTTRNIWERIRVYKAHLPPPMVFCFNSFLFVSPSLRQRAKGVNNGGVVTDGVLMKINEKEIPSFASVAPICSGRKSGCFRRLRPPRPLHARTRTVNPSLLNSLLCPRTHTCAHTCTHTHMCTHP